MLIRTKLLLSFLLVAIIVVIGGYFSLRGINKISTSLKNEIPKSVDNLVLASRLDRLAIYIRFYDEILTQSARNYAFTGDKKWEERYKDGEIKLDAIIKEAIEIGDENEKNFFSKIGDANLALIDLEHESIRLVDSAKASKAIEILESDDYWNWKKIYSANLDEYANYRASYHEQSILLSGSIIQSEVERNTDLLKNTYTAIISIVVFIFGLTLFLGHSVSDSVLRPIKKLSIAAEKITGGDFNQKIENKSNDEIGKLAILFNAMALKLKDSYDNLENKINQRTIELKEERETFKAIASSAYDAIIEIDNDGKVVFWNKAAVEMFGYGEKEIIGRELHKILAPSKYHEEYKKGFAGFKFTGQGSVVGKTRELSALKKNGTEFPIELSLSSVIIHDKWSAIGIVRDITERKKIEEELKRSKAEDDALLESIGEGIIAIDTDGRIIFTNRAATEMVGYSVEELKGGSLRDLIMVEGEEGKILPYEQRPMYLALKSGKTTTTITTNKTFYYTRKDKSRFPVSIVVAPIILNGKIIGAIDVFRDVTEEKRIDSMKTEFVSLASHQLRTPVTSIQWLIELFLKKEKLTPKGRNYLKDAHIAISRLSELVDTLLNLSRIESGSMGLSLESIELVKLVKKMIKETEMIGARKKIKITFKNHPKDLYIESDLHALNNVFQVVLTNTIEYTPEKGKVSVILEKKTNTFLCTISDTGIGIPKDDQNKIFGQFVRGSNAYLQKAAGVGVGLYIAKQATELLGGKIWFESEEGKGTTFYIEIPLKSRSIKGEKRFA